MSRRTSRDEMVEKGVNAANRAEDSFLNGKRTSQWLYKVKVRSGRGAVKNREFQAWNLTDLVGQIVLRDAVENEALGVTMIGRVMKKHVNSPREDY
jgi:hypothetical protein